MEKRPIPLISIVIPTLNEEENIGRLLKGIKRYMNGKRYEVLVVDGGSDDNTVGVARRMGARVSRDSRGKGSALIRGFNASRGGIVISMDADLSHEPRELALLIEGILTGYDVCVGSRFLSGGGTEDMSWFRKLGNKFFVMMVNWRFGSHYTDMCYGYRSFRKDVIRRLGLKEQGFGIETEININAKKKGFSVLEVPSTEKKRLHGEGKLRTFRDGYIILRTILKNF